MLVNICRLVLYHSWFANPSLTKPLFIIKPVAMQQFESTASHYVDFAVSSVAMLPHCSCWSLSTGTVGTRRHPEAHSYQKNPGSTGVSLSAIASILAERLFKNFSKGINRRDRRDARIQAVHPWHPWLPGAGWFRQWPPQWFGMLYSFKYTPENLDKPEI